MQEEVSKMKITSVIVELTILNIVLWVLLLLGDLILGLEDNTNPIIIGVLAVILYQINDIDKQRWGYRK